MKILICFVILLSACLFTQCKSSTATGSSNATLENTYWKLAEMNGMPVITPADSRDVHFILTKTENQNQLKGFAGCNTLAGSYTVEGVKISFTTITTRMFCEGKMEVENYFTKTLSDATAYKINGNVLELYQGETFLARFDAVYLK